MKAMEFRTFRFAFPSFFIVALLMHLAILSITPIWIPEVREKLEDKWVELWNRDSKKDRAEKSIVNTEEAVKKSTDTNKTARFGGEIDQRVEKETRAPLTGRFYQGRPRPTVPGEGGKFSMSDLLGLGSSPNALPDDIETGTSTVLNTDRVIYAGYFSRVADEVYSPWVRRVETVFQNITEHGRRMDPNIYTTRLRLTLNSDGEVKIIQVAKSSGIETLDEASKDAIWDREPFPNPPSQLIDEDGYLRLFYEFQVELKDSGFKILPWKT